MNFPIGMPRFVVAKCTNLSKVLAKDLNVADIIGGFKLKGTRPKRSKELMSQIQARWFEEWCRRVMSVDLRSRAKLPK